MADVDDFAKADRCARGKEIAEKRNEVEESVAAGPDYDKAKPESGQRVLKFQALVNGKKDIEVLLGENQEKSILCAAPAGLGDCSYRVAWKGCADSGMDTFV